MNDDDFQHGPATVAWLLLFGVIVVGVLLGALVLAIALAGG